MIASGWYRRMGFKARVWLSGGTLRWWRGGREKRRWVVGAGWALGQARR